MDLLKSVLNKIVPEAHAQTPNVAPSHNAPGNLPSWVYSALDNLYNSYQGQVSRPAHLTYSAGAQAIGNVLSRTPTAQEDLTTPIARHEYIPGVRSDIAGNNYKNQHIANNMSGLGSMYAQTLPATSFWQDKANVTNRRFDNSYDPEVGTQYQLQSGNLNMSQNSPFKAAYFTRDYPGDPQPATPEQGHMVHHGGGENVNDGNQGGWDEWVVDQPASPGWNPPDPSQQDMGLDQKQQNALQMAYWTAVLQASGGLNQNKFNTDMQSMRQQYPSMMNDLEFLNSPFYRGASQNQKNVLTFAQFAKKYGRGMLNTPLGSHYQGLVP